MTSRLKNLDNSVSSIIHEVNVGHSIDCNQRARYHIQKQCIIIHNKAIIKYNDLKEWIAGNQDASMEDIQLIISKIDAGDDVRGFKIERA